MPSWISALFGDDPDRSWEWLGKHDPYYGVLAADQYRNSQLDENRLRSFFDSGAAHVEHVLTALSNHMGPVERTRCLDFGSGVGRLAIPFSRHFTSVVGVDISAGMRAEAQQNCARFGIANARFVENLDQVEGPFDLVHSYIVLQHIPTRRGMQLIDQLIDRTASAGVCFLHVTTARAITRSHRLASMIRRNFKPLHYTLNAMAGRPFNEAYMQVNEYNLNLIFARLFDKGIRNIWVESENHRGPYSACLAFRVP